MNTLISTTSFFYQRIENQHQIHKIKQKQYKDQKEKKEDMMLIAANHNDSLKLSQINNNSEKVLLSATNEMNNIDSIGKKRIRNKFTPEEDQKLRELIQKHGQHSWNLVSSLMENRNQRQCRERWKHYLSCDMNEASRPWTKEEDSILINKFNELGAKWTKIALELPGRTDLQVKSRYMKSLRNKKHRHIQESDETESNDEVSDDPPEKVDADEKKENNNNNHLEIFSNIDTELIEKAFASIQPQQQQQQQQDIVEQKQPSPIAEITLEKPNNSFNNELNFGFDFNMTPSNLITEFCQINNSNFLNQGFEPEFYHWTFE